MLENVRKKLSHVRDGGTGVLPPEKFRPELTGGSRPVFQSQDMIEGDSESS